MQTGVKVYNGSLLSLIIVFIHYVLLSHLQSTVKVYMGTVCLSVCLCVYVLHRYKSQTVSEQNLHG